MKPTILLAFVLISLFFISPSFAQSIDVFQAHGDIGHPQKKGEADYDEQTQTYTITGGGENMWDTTDAFHML